VKRERADLQSLSHEPDASSKGENRMSASKAFRSDTLIIAALFGLSVSIIPALAAGDVSPPSPPPTNNNYNSGKSSQKKKPKRDQRSEREFQEFVDGYHAARALVLDGKYAEAIAAFRALDHDNSPEVSNYVGYAYRKLGDYDLAKVWYDRALAADPDHVRTWEYYGLWHLEQGNKLKAQDYLEKVRVLCGNTTCQEYVDLKSAIEGDRHSY
jgi:tetratricopeptide (TPR) repeat protein